VNDEKFMPQQCDCSGAMGMDIFIYIKLFIGFRNFGRSVLFGAKVTNN